jgi:diaminopimelate decarboxylase
MPCFIYDAAAVRERAALAASVLDQYFFPVKACPEPEVIRAATSTGAGLDLCSAGDVELASAVGCPGSSWKFTAAHADEGLLRSLVDAGVSLDADSLEQALRWAACGGTACGLRLTARRPNSLYGSKFGLGASVIATAARSLGDAGLLVEGLHLHDQHANLAPHEFALRLAENLADVDSEFLSGCRYVNVGGSWPMRHGVPASIAEIRAAFGVLRERLLACRFQGELYAEPGRWVVGPCGYWAARVVAVKRHPTGDSHRGIILDTSTPVPCRPSLAPFVVLRDGVALREHTRITCDIYGSANTALDCLGKDVRLPPLEVGDLLVSLGQGAYTRSLIPPFNERERPRAVVLG